MTAADRFLQVVIDGRRRYRIVARANADSLNRNGHADSTLLERGRAGRGEVGVADRVIAAPARRLMVVEPC